MPGVIPGEMLGGSFHLVFPQIFGRVRVKGYLTPSIAGYRNQIRNTTWRIISVYHRVITLTLFRLFDCNLIPSL